MHTSGWEDTDLRDGVGDDLTVPALGLAVEALSVAESDPRRALVLARDAARLGHQSQGDDSALEGTIAWARGIACRQLGQRREALDGLEHAVSLLVKGGNHVDAARASVPLSFEYFNVGRVDDALTQLEWAEERLTGIEAARAAAQRALVLNRSGLVGDSLRSWDRVVEKFQLADSPVDVAKALHQRGLVHAYLGEFDSADRDLAVARDILAQRGEETNLSALIHNQGFLAARRGDLPRALHLFDEAQQRMVGLGVLRPAMLVDRVETMLDAGLTSEARDLAEEAVARLADAGFEADRAEACLLVARACEACRDGVGALGWAEQAQVLFGTQGRPGWERLSEYAALRARAARPPYRDRDLDRWAAIGEELRVVGWWASALEADARAVAVLDEAGRPEEAGAILVRLARHRRRAPALNRLAVWLAEARHRSAHGERESAERALAAGLRALLDYRATLGSVELRSRTVARAGEIIQLGVRLALERNRPDRALHWMEAVRAGQELAVGDVGKDPEVAQVIEALRRVTARFETEPMGTAEAQRLRRKQAALEEALRRRTRSVSRQGAPDMRPADVKRVADALGPRCLIEYATVAETLVALVLQDGRCRLVEVGAVSEARRAVAALRLELRADPLTGDPSALRHAAASVERFVVAPLGSVLTPAGVVIVPDGPVASVAWGVLPALAEVDVVVAPSATSWLEGDLRLGGLLSWGRVAVVAGPGLRHAEDEARAVASAWGEQAVIISGEDATVERVLAAMNEAAIVHIAAHGSFRSDNPLLSAIRLADGPLTGYDLARFRAPPSLVVLSCCDTGMSDSETGALGLSGLLVGAGVTGSVASVAPVSDDSSKEMMLPFHRALRMGSRPARALTQGRVAVAPGPSAAGFVCFGAG